MAHLKSESPSNPTQLHPPSNLGNISFKRGDRVEVFYRHEYDGSGDGPNAYFPVHYLGAAQCTPRLGKTDGWQPATVIDNFSMNQFQSLAPEQTGVHVQLLHPHWNNRHGELLDMSNPMNSRVRIHPADVRLSGDMENRPTVDTSFVVVRWGGLNKTPSYDQLPGEEGGWGSIGTSICDGYIRAFFQRVYERLGPTYEVFAIYISANKDLNAVTSQMVIPQLSGSRHAGMYFLWPVANSLEGNPGYVEKDALFKCMRELEMAGVNTCFPYTSNLYKLVVSKDWTSYMCYSPSLRVPATTKVPRSLIVSDPMRAAQSAISALSSHRQQSSKPLTGVAKLGYSWEASDVLSWNNAQDLSMKLRNLVTQPGCEADSVFVQERVPSDCEIRVFCLDGLPVKMLYTKFCENTHEGAFTSFKRLERPAALNAWFGGCEKALAHAEAEMGMLTSKWVKWLRGECCEVPTFVRIDYFVKREGDKSVVTTGEITEIGASCLGWEEGWTATFDAAIKAATGKPFPNLLPPLPVAVVDACDTAETPPANGMHAPVAKRPRPNRPQGYHHQHQHHYQHYPAPHHHHHHHSYHQYPPMPYNPHQRW